MSTTTDPDLDNSIAAVIEDGVERGAFFKRVTLPRIVGGAGNWSTRFVSASSQPRRRPISQW